LSINLVMWMEKLAQSKLEEIERRFCVEMEIKVLSYINNNLCYFSIAGCGSYQPLLEDRPQAVIQGHQWQTYITNKADPHFEVFNTLSLDVCTN
jgi:hypothetical protein